MDAEAMDALGRTRSTGEFLASAELLRVFIQNAPVALAMFDRDLRFIAVSQQYIETFNAPRDLIGRCAYDVFPEVPERWKQFHKRALAGESVSVEQDLFLRSNLQAQWVKWKIDPWFESEGKVGGILLAAEDITSQVEAQTRLREIEERARFVAESSDVGFWFCDLPFDKLIWDKRVKAHFWLPEDAEVTIDTFYNRLHPDDREPTRQAIAHSIDNHLQYDIEYRTMSDRGEHKWIRAIGRTSYDDRNAPKRFDGVTLDVTARRKTDDALRASETKYRELADTLERQVQARTLELRKSNEEAIRISRGLRELSLHLLRVRDEERRKIARELHDSAGQLLTALDLELSGLELSLQGSEDREFKQLAASKQLVQQLQREIRTTSYLLHPPLLDEAGLVSALRWYVQGLDQRSGLQTEIDIAENFGRLPRDMELVVFRLVQESMTNIHRHSGSKTAFVRVTRDNASVRIEIRDQGKGIPPGKLHEIQTGGSGVGVQGMQERLRQYGGSLLIDSDGTGTRVSAIIPISEAATGGDVSAEPMRAVS